MRKTNSERIEASSPTITRGAGDGAGGRACGRAGGAGARAAGDKRFGEVFTDEVLKEAR